MKKFILSMVVIISFGSYVISQNIASSSGNLNAPLIIPNNNSNKQQVSQIVTTSEPKTTTSNPPVKTTSKPGVVTPKPTPVVVPKKTGIYNDGGYVGPSVDAYFGNVQVKAIISNGRLTDVQFLDYPQDRSTSVRINSRALPILRQEAISAQSANINAVSGASATSPAFIESLTAALNQARV